MSITAFKTNPEQQRALEAFYFLEARLLDNRQYQQWLALVTEDIEYRVPARVNVQVENRDRGNESMIAVERELETFDSMGCPIREENYIHLMVRVERAFKMNSWSENPPARTRRIVGNVECIGSKGQAREVLSNFHLYYARPGSVNCLYSGQRRDELLVDGDSFKLNKRDVILDYSDIELPTLGLLF